MPTWDVCQDNIADEANEAMHAVTTANENIVNVGGGYIVPQPTTPMPPQYVAIGMGGAQFKQLQIPMGFVNHKIRFGYGNNNIYHSNYIIHESTRLDKSNSFITTNKIGLTESFTESFESIPDIYDIHNGVLYEFEPIIILVLKYKYGKYNYNNSSWIYDNVNEGDTYNIYFQIDLRRIGNTAFSNMIDDDSYHNYEYKTNNYIQYLFDKLKGTQQTIGQNTRWVDNPICLKYDDFYSIYADNTNNSIKLLFVHNITKNFVYDFINEIAIDKSEGPINPVDENGYDYPSQSFNNINNFGNEHQDIIDDFNTYVKGTNSNNTNVSNLIIPVDETTNSYGHVVYEVNNNFINYNNNPNTKPQYEYVVAGFCNAKDVIDDLTDITPWEFDEFYDYFYSHTNWDKIWNDTYKSSPYNYTTTGGEHKVGDWGFERFCDAFGYSAVFENSNINYSNWGNLANTYKTYFTTNSNPGNWPGGGFSNTINSINNWHAKQMIYDYLYDGDENGNTIYYDVNYYIELGYKEYMCFYAGSGNSYLCKSPAAIVSTKIIEIISSTIADCNKLLNTENFQYHPISIETNGANKKFRHFKNLTNINDAESDIISCSSIARNYNNIEITGGSADYFKINKIILKVKK